MHPQEHAARRRRLNARPESMAPCRPAQAQSDRLPARPILCRPQGATNPALFHHCSSESLGRTAGSELAQRRPSEEGIARSLFRRGRRCCWLRPSGTRSGHGFFSSAQVSAISGPTDFVKLSRMSSVDEPIPATVNSAVADTHDGEDRIGEPMVREPLVHDLQQVHHEFENMSVQESTAPLSDTTSSFQPQPLGSHLTSKSEDEDSAPPPPDFTRRGIHIPMRTSSSTATYKSRFNRASSVPTAAMSTTVDSGGSHHARSTRSSADSVMSFETQASSIATQALPALQQKGPLDELDRLSPLLEDDPKSFDLVAPNESDGSRGFNLETRSEQLFSKEHLEAIFNDTPSLLRFTAFLSMARPASVPILIYYLDALKAMRAINYANAVAEALEPIEGYGFTDTPARSTVNAVLEDKARQAFDVLVREDLPAFITHVYIQLVSVSIQKRVTGNLPPMLREASEGLAEVFCLSDPSRTDNPLIFASEEFHRTTQYGVSYAIGRNCRFLQGPRTNRNSIARLRKAVQEGKEVSEVFLNYRRDGSPFMNLLMMAPLLDSRGNLRYFIGAQVDVSGLVKDATDLDALQQYLAVHEGGEAEEESKDEFQELSKMFNHSELETVRKYGGKMHREHLEEQDDTASMHHSRPRVLIKDMTSFEVEKAVSVPVKAEGRLAGVYKHYLLIRPAPSLRILFVSPSLRVPGILQSRFLDRIGGSSRVRDSLAEALADGSRGVTAKIRWLSTAAADLDIDRVEEGRPRWIHCTPLLGQSGAVGVWMVVLVDDEKSGAPTRRFRQAPPVASNLRQHQGVSSGPQSLDGDSDFERRQARQFSMQNGNGPRHNVVEALRRPGSSVNDQRAVRSYSPPPMTGGGGEPRSNLSGGSGGSGVPGPSSQSSGVMEKALAVLGLSKSEETVGGAA
ncbi:hypothetical protein K458DRAFT_398373 [Lentithecium fluviatile CBS 122367]|uniref:PAC domain-containing protein n=1 Tax=Lentithecium fluviatile CBS 122367 TaxID=1168545 RepID=A0A6G1JN61_9PLEO|nr:hypothetical protein K458DRAFT_398373 [Lentithecium fluviatile CBS 122367]